MNILAMRLKFWVAGLILLVSLISAMSFVNTVSADPLDPTPTPTTVSNLGGGVTGDSQGNPGTIDPDD